MNLILMGAPGAGKGTQAVKISEKFQIPTISTGDTLRRAIQDGTAMGMRAKSYMDEGKLVPDEVVIGIIKDYLASDACKNGFILDGFPRSLPQAQALDTMGVTIDAVVSIEVPDEVIVERMSGRRVCGCGASYHTKYNPPKVADVCDKCGAALYVRADDNADTVRNRLNTFHEITEPIAAFYDAKGKLLGSTEYEYDENGKVKSSYDAASGISGAHPRSAVGYFEPGHYCFIVVDGRQDHSHGLTISELAKVFEELGCKAAYNLDGGGSAQILVNNRRSLMISDRNASDHTEAERPVPLALYIAGSAQDVQ